MWPKVNTWLLLCCNFSLNYWGLQYQTYTLSSRNIDRIFHVFRVTYYDRMIWLILLKRQNFSVKNETLNNPAEENIFPHNIYPCNLSHLYINMWSFNLPYTVKWDANRYLIIYHRLTTHFNLDWQYLATALLANCYIWLFIYEITFITVNIYISIYIW